MQSQLNLLQQSNRKYLSNPMQTSTTEDTAVREKLSTGQHPHTMVLSCADSRVPVEKILDGQIGDYFVVRSAGNVAETSQIASLEFGAAVLGAKTLLVLGHTACGAVSAAVDVVQENATLPSKHLTSLAQMITPAVEKTIAGKDLNKPDCISQSTEENVRHQIKVLKESSDILRNLADKRELEFLGGVYDIKTGEINFIQI